MNDIVDSMNDLLEELDRNLPPPLNSDDIPESVTDDDLHLARQHLVGAIGHVRAAVAQFEGVAEALGVELYDLFDDEDDDDD